MIGAQAQTRVLEGRRPGDPPRTLYFNLLFADELADLRPILAEVRRRRGEVLHHWYELYRDHFADERSLREPEFLRIAATDFDATMDTLVRGDVEAFVSGVHAVGRDLADRGVPFPEVITSLHFFEQAATAAFPADGSFAPRTYLSFDKLSHCRMIVLADAYFQTTRAAVVARIDGLERDVSALEPDARRQFHGIVGASAPMRRLYERIAAAASTRGTVLIVGESGTGKELVARAIHECAGAPEKPFVALNCAAIPSDLIESELFGYKRGAFSGAVSEYAGLFRAAGDGSLFLDEITEMGPDTQSKLLRAIQEKRIRPVGSTAEMAVDVRLIASTNRDPEEAVREGRLRRDLYYRLHVNVLEVPPLRDRLDDLSLLAEHFVTLFNERMRPPVPVIGIDHEAMCALQRFDWPGNVRELSNAIEAAFTFGSGDTIRLCHLPPAVSRRADSLLAPRSASAELRTFAEVERDLVERALATTFGNKVQAAKLLRISRKKLYAKIAKYGLRG